MKKQADWRPTKFELRGERLRASRYESGGSWMMTDLMACEYEGAIRRLARGKLLDLGCGSVPLFGLYRSLVSEVTCVDWEGSCHGCDYLDFAHDLNRPLPLESFSYSVVLLSDLLEHIYDPRTLLGEVFRVLSPGGVAIIGVPFMYWIHEAPHDYFRYTEHALERMLKESGFEIEALERVGGIVEVIADMWLKVIARGSPRIARIIARAMSAMAKSKIGRNVAKKSSKVTPLAYVVVGRKPT